MLAPTQRLAALLILVVAACGPRENVLRWITPADNLNQPDIYRDVAQAFFDQGALDKAWDMATKAYSLDPESEKTSLLLGYIAIAKAGADPISLARSMLKADRSESREAKAGLLPESQDLATGSLPQILSRLQSSMGFAEEEFGLFGRIDLTDPLIPLYIPLCANEGRKASSRLAALNQAIILSCPYVDPEIRNQEDGRQICEPAVKTPREPDRAHLLWGLAHLAEAITFQSLINYSSIDKTKTNLELRAEKIGKVPPQGPDEINKFTTDVQDFQTIVSSLFPKRGACFGEKSETQFQSIVFDLLAVNAGFAKLVSAPANIKTTIERISDQIVRSQDRLTQLKDQFSIGAARRLNENVESVLKSQGDSLTPEQKQSICASVAGLESPSVPRPPSCET